MQRFVIISLLILFISNSTYAYTFKCVGMYPDGEPVNVIGDSDSSSLIINGAIYKIDRINAGTVYTKSITNDEGVSKYFAMTKSGSSNYSLGLYYSNNNALIGEVSLACSP